ncbi:zinc ribbon domain-containing protein [Paraburkholderia caribensis]|uniref:zinc ribbon domain-containing protein n=1 Tax=Paraburkholderia caribensis TaxID=75105 RepID=UPI0034D1CDBA
MPLYDYRCEACGNFEVMRKVAQREEPACCPVCGLTGVRVQTSPSLLFSSSTSAADISDAAGSYGMKHRGGCSCC